MLHRLGHRLRVHNLQKQAAGCFCTVPGSGAAEPAERPAAKRSYTFMESAEILLAHRNPPKVIDRWDWHVWQVIVALLPSLVVVGLAQWARQDQQKLEAKKKAKRVQKWEEELAKFADEGAAGNDALEQIGKRIDALSAAVADLQAKQAGPALKGLDVQGELAQFKASLTRRSDGPPPTAEHGTSAAAPRSRETQQAEHTSDALQSATGDPDNGSVRQALHALKARMLGDHPPDGLRPSSLGARQAQDKQHREDQAHLEWLKKRAGHET